MKRIHLPLIVLLLVSFSVAQAQNVTLKFKDAPLENVMKEIRSRTGYDFVYNNKLVDDKRLMTVEVLDESLESVLGKVFSPIGISYVVKDKQIVLYPKTDRKQVRVKGSVRSEDGEPLAGVFILEPASKSTAVSDVNGGWAIDVSSNSVLTFSFLGYKELNVAVPSGQASLEVVLQEDMSLLEEARVVSVGYGSVAKRDLTGSVASANVPDIMKSSVTTFDQALSGRIAGVVVTTSDGQVGKEADIVIRGSNSITQSNAPLYVVDGFALESSTALSINPSDIESLDVLKDASATAIYGARGANGVIIINTKSGSMEGTPKVNFNSKVTFSTIANKMDLMDAFEFVDFYTEVSQDGGAQFLEGYRNPYLTDDIGSTLFSVEDYRNAPTYDWQDRTYRNSVTQNYGLSLSGGTRKTGTVYDISFSVLDQDGIVVKSDFQRYQGRIKLQQSLGKKFNLNLNINYARTINNGVSPTDAHSVSVASGWLNYSIWGYRPTIPLHKLGDADEWLTSMTDEEVMSSQDYRFNPALTVRNEYRKTLADNLSASASFFYNITDGLQFKLSQYYALQNREARAFNGSDTYSGYDRSPSGMGVNGSIKTTGRIDYSTEATLTWNKHVESKHHINLLGGSSLVGQNLSFYGVAANHLSTESLGIYGLHTGDYQVVAPYRRDWTMLSAFLRLNYNYKYLYYLTATFRADGSSKFPVDNRWGYFPSASLAWNFSNEPFLKQSKRWLKNGKLRLSWGQTGNNRTSTPYDHYAQITTMPGSARSLDWVVDGQTVPGYFPSNMQNDDLRWETTEQWDLGLDLAFLEDSRLKLTLDAYQKSTKDLLMNATMPYSTGYKTALMNIGGVRNRGLEVSLETLNVKRKDFQWYSSFNIANNQNRVTGLSGNENVLMSAVTWSVDYNSQFAYITKVGMPTGMMFGYIYEGTYKESDFTGGVLNQGVAYMSNFAREKIRPGDPKYTDINKDGVVDVNDQTIIGYGQPFLTGGFNNSFYWKGFDLNIFFSWSYGNDVLNANRLVFEAGNSGYLNQLASYAGRYREGADTQSDIPRVRANGTNNYSSRVIEDGSFLKLKNISLGYTIKDARVRGVGIEDIRLFLSLDNIWTWTRYSGPDPEVSIMNSVLTPGFDWSAYPRAKGGTVGLSVNF